MPSRLYAATREGMREVGYWRRADQVRYWFRERFGQGLADPKTGTHFLSRAIRSEDMYELYALCAEVEEEILTNPTNWEATVSLLLPPPPGSRITRDEYATDVVHTQEVIQRAAGDHTPETEYFYQEEP